MLAALLMIGSMSIGSTQMSTIPPGELRPLYLSEDSPLVNVSAFGIDQVPVTNRKFHDFVIAHPRWQKQNLAAVFADSQYLTHWNADKNGAWQPTPHSLDAPVVNVSWFAAHAFCEVQNKKLPTVVQWEMAALAGERSADGANETGFNEKILNWYAHHIDVQKKTVGQSKPNFWGVHDLHGLIWEWTEDFNSILVSGESRADSAVDQKLFCASGSVGAADPKNYAAFMRYGFRSSLQATYNLPNLGFRCVSEN